MEKIIERIEDDKIFVDENGNFPKELVFCGKDENGAVTVKKKRILRKTRNGGFILN